MSKRYFAGISGAGGKPRAVLCIYLFNVFFYIIFDYDGTTCPHTQYSSTAWGHKDKDTRGARVSSFDIIDRRCGVW